MFNGGKRRSRTSGLYEDYIKMSSSSSRPGNSGVFWFFHFAGDCSSDLNPSQNPSMKYFNLLTLIGAASVAFSACQNGSHTPPPNNFAEKTHRTYNPQTGAFEQSPPWGKQSNKSTSDQPVSQ
jgi:hypothetical protein